MDAPGNYLITFYVEDSKGLYDIKQMLVTCLLYTSRRFMAKLEAAQLDAILNQHSNSITLSTHQLCFNEVCEALPASRSADEGKIEFNAAGNVNHAGTYCFHEGNQCRCIVIQLGSGRMALE